MCGIAGYSLRSRSGVDRTLAAQALLAAIAERGADAVGYAYRGPRDAYATVVKQRTPASQLLERVSVPETADQLLVHVRDYTKGHPSIAANNHPVRHGPVIGVHNGIIVNDDELLVEHSCSRAEPRMTVDSEAIFALAAHSRNDVRALEALAGSMAAAWLDAREPELVFVARGSGRPLWIGEAPARASSSRPRGARSTSCERYCGLRLRKHEVAEGIAARRLRDGAIVRGTSASRRDRSFRRARTRCPPSGRPQRARASASTRARVAHRRRLSGRPLTAQPFRRDRRSRPPRRRRHPRAGVRATRDWNVDQAPRFASNIR